MATYASVCSYKARAFRETKQKSQQIVRFQENEETIRRSTDLANAPYRHILQRWTRPGGGLPV